jgi:hypothetical protein
VARRKILNYFYSEDSVLIIEVGLFLFKVNIQGYNLPMVRRSYLNSPWFVYCDSLCKTFQVTQYWTLKDEP